MMHMKFLLLLISVSELGAVPILLSYISSIKLLDSEQPSNITTATGNTFLSSAVDYHYKRGEIYFSNGQGRIYRSWMRGENAKKDPLVIVEAILVDGLAVDWVNDNLYWTEVYNKRIKMATLDGLSRRVLFNASDGLDKPRAIVVDPSEGLLFWSDWGENGKILSSGLDGKRKTILASNFDWPNGLTLDLSKKKVYIVDGLASTLSSCNYDGSNLEEIYKSSLFVQLAYGLTYFSNTLYWTSWKESRLIQLSIATKNAAVIHQTKKFGGVIEGVNGVKAVDSSLQPDRPQANPCDVKHCSHQCLPSYQGTASCVCPFGFTLSHDEKTCAEQGYLLVSWQNTIRSHDLYGTKEQSLLDTTARAIAVDYHYKKSLVFWSDLEEHKLYRAPLEQLNNKTVVASVESSVGLAVDWIHDVLYWTDMNRSVLMAASLDGSNYTDLITQDLNEPRALALDPLKGMMFWSSWGNNPKIESANLDGSNRQVTARDDMVWPNGITIDYDRKRLYWVDVKLKTISSCLYDGSQRRQILGSQIVSLKPFGISLLGDYLYWTDWDSQSLMKIPKTIQDTNTIILANSSSLKMLDSAVQQPSGIKAVHSTVQRTQDNPCATINCKSLCLGSPASPSKVRCMGAEVEPYTNK